VVTELTNLGNLAFYLSSLFPFTLPIIHVLAPIRRQTRPHIKNGNRGQRCFLGADRSCTLIGNLQLWLKRADCRHISRSHPFCSGSAICLLLALSAAAVHAESTNTPVLTTPAPGSVLPGSSVSFTWTTDAWASTYELFLGTVFKTDNLGAYTVSPSKNSTVSVSVAGLPTNGAPIYAILSWTSSGVKHYKNYTYTAATKSSTPTLSVNSSSISFGQVTLNAPSTQSLTLMSTGTASLTLSSATVSGAGFSATGISFPKTLNPGQSATLDVEFDPTAAGSASGKLVIASNSSSGSSTTVTLSGTGEAASGYRVNLSWDAGSTGVQIAGYHIYRAISGSSEYQELNSSLDTSISYTDATVKDSTTYDYYIEAVSSSGVSSAPSTVLSIAVP
jgi:hypothetical protein